MYFPWGKDVRLGKSFLWMTLGKGNYITVEKKAPTPYTLGYPYPWLFTT
jgi:hypothetical protein